MKVKVIFLDFDGVLNQMHYGGWVNDQRNYYYNGLNFNPLNCNKLEHIIKNTGAKIVVSSYWRTNFTIEELAEHLQKAGVESADVIGKTPDLETSRSTWCRGDEVQQWLDENDEYEIEKYIIIDDLYHFLMSQGQYLIKTVSGIGLTLDLAKEAIVKLS